MAFDENYYGNAFSTMNQKAPTARCYTSSGDTLATITASAYFNNRIRDLKVGTLIYVNASDANALIEVTSVTTNVTTAVLVSNLVAAQTIAAGLFTTAGGDVTETITATGALATDTAIVTVNTVGSTPRIIITAIGATDAITVTFDGDPSTDHVLNYMVVRAL